MPASPTRRQTPDTRKCQSHSLQTQVTHSRPGTALGLAGSWPCPLAGQHKLWKASDFIPNCFRKQSPPHQKSDNSCGIPEPEASLQDLTLPPSSPTLIPGSELTHQCGRDNSLRVFWTLTLLTSEPALPLGTLGFCCQQTKMMKGKNLQPIILYRARISFRFDGENKNFTDKQKLKDIIDTKPAVQQMLKEFL